MRDELAVLGFPGYKRVKVHNEIRSKNLRVQKGGKSVCASDEPATYEERRIQLASDLSIAQA